MRGTSRGVELVWIDCRKGDPTEVGMKAHARANVEMIGTRLLVGTDSLGIRVSLPIFLVGVIREMIGLFNVVGAAPWTGAGGIPCATEARLFLETTMLKPSVGRTSGEARPAMPGPITHALLLE